MIALSFILCGLCLTRSWELFSELVLLFFELMSFFLNFLVDCLTLNLIEDLVWRIILYFLFRIFLVLLLDLWHTLVYRIIMNLLKFNHRRLLFKIAHNWAVVPAPNWALTWGKRWYILVSWWHPLGAPWKRNAVRIPPHFTILVRLLLLSCGVVFSKKHPFVDFVSIRSWVLEMLLKLWRD